MKKIKSIKLAYLSILFFILFFVLCDLFYSLILFDRVNINKIKNEQKYRIVNASYHHGFKENFSGHTLWGNINYEICTDKYGFKVSCSNDNLLNKNQDQYDLAFIGDSQTEGIGLSYEDTFVGIFARNHPELKIANLAVASYSPTIHFQKIKYFLDKGIKFKHIVVYVDISDLQDDILYNPDLDNYTRDSQPNYFWKKLNKFTKKYFKTANYLINIKRDSIKSRSRGDWTYNADSAWYGKDGIEKGTNISLYYMKLLHNLCKKNNIKLSLGVYPWPEQVLNDDLANNLQTNIWGDFCKDRCEFFINHFDQFTELTKDKPSKKTFVDNYYFPNDVHYNKDGNLLISNFLNKILMTNI